MTQVTTGGTEEMVLALLEEALNAGMLVEEGAGAQVVYRFWHPILAEYLYGLLSATKRLTIQRRVERLRAAQ